MSFIQRLGDFLRGPELKKDVKIGSVYKIGNQYTNNINNVDAYVQEGYAGNSAVYSIITAITRKFSSIPVYVYDVKNLKDLRAFQSFEKGLTNHSPENLYKLKTLRNKAIELYTDTDEVSRILYTPNQYQGNADLLENLLGWKLISGMGLLWSQQGLGGKPVELHVLPSSRMRIIGNDTLNGVDHYEWNGYRDATFLNQDVLRWIYWSPYVDPYTKSHLYGLSPIRAAGSSVDEWNNASKAINYQFINKGADGFLFGKGAPIPSSAVDDLQQDLDNRVNGAVNQGRVIAFTHEVGYTQVGLSAADMQVIEAKRYTFEDLCNVFGVPQHLFASDKAKGMSGGTMQQEAMKQLVSNRIIPEICSIKDYLNKWLVPKFGLQGKKYIDFDITELTEFQPDAEKVAAAGAAMWWKTGNEKRIMTGDDPLPDPLMDKIILPSSNILLDDIEVQQNQQQSDMNTLNQNGIKEYGF